jgi:hypothetical protein
LSFPLPLLELKDRSKEAISKPKTKNNFDFRIQKSLEPARKILVKINVSKIEN